MSYALITDGGEDGRYTVYLDYGEDQRAAILQQVALAQASLATKIVEQQVQVDAADARVSASLANLQALQDQLIAEMAAPGYADDPSFTAQLKLYNFFASEHQKLVISLEPVYSVMRTLKTQQARAASQYAHWSGLSLSETKQAWCCDLTENATGYVATVDIPGEPSLVLVAPGGRSWVGKDGTIAQSKKDAALSLLQGRLTIAEAEQAELTAKLAVATAAESTLKLAVTNAQAALVAARLSGDFYAIQEAQKAFDDATKALNDNRQLVAQLTFAVFNSNARVAKINNDLAIWSAKPASATPQYGDGLFLARDLMSPEQAYFNAAILPGWQKWLPTYRRGTLTAINRELNKGTVELFDEVSSAQRLPINQDSILVDVPFEYMECHNRAFQENDEVVVYFENQNWSSPKIIGFVDNPSACDFMCLGAWLLNLQPYPCYFQCISQNSASIVSSIHNGLATVTGRIIDGEGGLESTGWTPFELDPFFSSGLSPGHQGQLIWSVTRNYVQDGGGDNRQRLFMVTAPDISHFPTAPYGSPPWPDKTKNVIGFMLETDHPERPQSGRDIGEIRVYINGEIVINLAIEDALYNLNFPGSSYGVSSPFGILLQGVPLPAHEIPYVLGAA